MFFGLTVRQIEQIEADLQAVPDCGWKQGFDSVLAGCTPEEALCLKFLYAYMPAGDLVTYGAAFFLKAVRDTLMSRPVLSWKEKVVGEMFLNYVLPVRLNNEDLTDHRKLFFDELYPRVKDLSMREAALEVNYWCYEHATYKSTDDRTCSPLGVLKNAAGRCGEESVLCVAALRSVGLPARQCYTPRWAHCDDNHAWVEVWTGDSWHYIGACEPEPALDKGWFTEPASRAMLVHARAFTRLMSEPEVTNQTPVMAQVNLLSHYAPVKHLEVLVTKNGKPVQGAGVQFQLINFAQLYPIATQQTDEKGRACLMTGFGDLYVQVIHDGKFLFQKAEHTCVQLVFKMEQAIGYETGSMELDMVPPSPAVLHDAGISPEVEARHRQRMEYADFCCKAIEETFLRDEKAKEAAGRFPEFTEEIASLLALSNGNREEILTFLRADRSAFLKEKVQLLQSLRSKDLSDSSAAVLKNHLTGALPYQADYPEELFVSYLLCPRADNEMLTDYRGFISGYFTKEQKKSFQDNPRKVLEFIESYVKDCGDREYATISGSPEGLLRCGYGSALSRKLLFVAICRTLGIPARLSPVDKTMEYWQNGWKKAGQETGQSQADCELLLCAGPEESYVYERNLTVARLENGVYHTLGLGEVPFQENRAVYRLETGRYRITTANRLADGTVLAELAFVNLKPGEPVSVVLRLRKPDAQNQNEVKLPPVSVMTENGEGKISELLSAGVPCALAFLETGKEPTEHLLNEILEQAKEFLAFRDRLLLICKAEQELSYPLLVKAQKAAGFMTAVAKDGAFDAVLEATGSQNRKYPLVLGLNAAGSCVYRSSGYNVGTGDWLLKCFQSASD